MAPAAPRSPWRVGDLRRLYACYAAALSSECMVSLALMVELLDRTGSAAWLAAVATLRFLPAILIGPVGGVVAERWDRRRVLMAVGAARAAVLAGLAVAVALQAPPLVLVLVAVLDATVVTPLRPASVALLPELSPETLLPRANAALGLVVQATWLIGSVLAAAAMVLAGPWQALVLTSVLVLAGSGAAARITGRAGRGVDLVAPPPPWEMLTDGVRAVRATPGAPMVLLASCTAFVVAGAELVLHVLVAEDRLGLGAEGVGWLVAAMGVGGILGAPLAGRAAASRHTARWFSVAAAVFAVALAALAAVHTPALALAILAVEGVANVVFDVAAITLLQRLLLGRGVLARGQALFDATAAMWVVAGTLVTPLLLRVVSLEATLVAVGGFGVVAAMACLPGLARVDQSTQSHRDAIADVVVLLGGTELLRGAPLVVVEQLASAAVATDLVPGVEVVRQGDVADDVYVVVEGALDVFIDGPDARRHMNRLGVGAWFGEIGVIRRMPRTATVVTTVPSRVLRISGETFLSATALAAGIEDTLQQGISVHLARAATGPGGDAAADGAAANGAAADAVEGHR